MNTYEIYVATFAQSFIIKARMPSIAVGILTKKIAKEYPKLRGRVLEMQTQRIHRQHYEMHIPELKK